MAVSPALAMQPSEPLGVAMLMAALHCEVLMEELRLESASSLHTSKPNGWGALTHGRWEQRRSSEPFSSVDPRPPDTPLLGPIPGKLPHVIVPVVTRIYRGTDLW